MKNREARRETDRGRVRARAVCGDAGGGGMWFPWQPEKGWALGVRSSSALHRLLPLSRLTLHLQPPLKLPPPLLSFSVPPQLPPSCVRRKLRDRTQPVLSLDLLMQTIKPVRLQSASLLCALVPSSPLIFTPPPPPPPHFSRSGLSWEANACGHCSAMCHWPCCDGERVRKQGLQNNAEQQSRAGRHTWQERWGGSYTSPPQTCFFASSPEDALNGAFSPKPFCTTAVKSDYKHSKLQWFH